MGEWSQRDWNQQSGESGWQRDQRIGYISAQDRNNAELIANSAASRNRNAGGVGPFVPPDKTDAIIGLAVVLSIVPWLLVVIFEIGSGRSGAMLVFRIAGEVSAIFAVNYLISKVLVAFWKLVLLAALLMGGYYGYRHWGTGGSTAKSEPVKTKQKRTLPPKNRSTGKE